MNHWKISAISHIWKLIEEILELKRMEWNTELLERFHDQVREKNRVG